MKILSLSTGDEVYRYYKSVAVIFKGRRKVLSTSPFNGGYREDLKAIFNQDCNTGTGMPCAMKAQTYEAHLEVVAQELGLEPSYTTGMSTAAYMKNLAVAVEKYNKLTVTALITGGVEVNGGRAGDPASYFDPEEEKPLDKHGTINIMLIIDADVSPGILTRALVTCTEAKTAVLQELLAGSCYSSGIATGSGTDGTIIVANSESSMYLSNAGKHSKLGELIGKAVKKALREALYKQTGLCPEEQHSVLARLKRYHISEEVLWQNYQAMQSAEEISKADFIDKLARLDKDDTLVTYVSLYVHLLDQLDWQMLSTEEVTDGCSAILDIIAQKFNMPIEQVYKQNKNLEGFCHVLTVFLTNLVVK